MNIALVNPSYKQDLNSRYEKYYIRSGSRWPHSGVKRKGTKPHYLPFPFFLAYSAALLKDKGFNVYVIDAVALDLSEAGFLSKIKKFRPDLIFYEITTPTCEYDFNLAKKIKSLLPKVFIVVGGTHATTFGESVLRQNESIDFVLKGEYEMALRDLAQNLKNGDKNFPPGIVYRKEKLIIDDGRYCFIDCLDDLPYPAREMFPSNDYSNPQIYWDGFCQNYPAIQMHASRGCPYKCYFCLWNQVIYRGCKYRKFSPKRVVDEMEEVIKRYDAREIYFDDDDFTIDKNHVLTICKEIIKRKLNIKWSCMGDAINIDEKVLCEMANSGCIGIKFGVESASEKILSTIGKPVDLNKVISLADLCRKYKIKSHATFTIGLIDESEEDLLDTIKFAENLNVDSIQISIATPFPGTKFFRIAEEKKLLRSKDWNLYDGKVFKVISHPSLEWGYVEKLRERTLIKWALKKIFSRKKIIRLLYIFLRTLKGIGFKMFLRKFSGVVIDEVKNK